MTVYTGSGANDAFRLSSKDGDSKVSGGLGYDTLFIDLHDRPGSLDYADDFRYDAGSGLFLCSGLQNIKFSGIERVAGILSDSDDNIDLGLGGTISLDGGAGYDYLDADFGRSTSNITFVLAGPGTWSAMIGQGSRIKNFEEVNISTGSGNDRLIGNDQYTTFRGGGGNDHLDGRGGLNELYGDAGNDRMFGGTFEDVVHGGVGDDFIDGGVGNDELMGDAGIDTLSYGSAASGVSVIFREGHSAMISGGGGSDSAGFFERVIGSKFSDSLTGDSIVNYLNGDAGDDTVKGGLGEDTVIGGGGVDALDGGDGNDRITGGAAGDTLIGGSGDDALFGGNSVDNLAGGTGIDRLLGEDGSDIIAGGGGNDVLTGGLDKDSLTGGAGSDLFNFGSGETGALLAQADRITDFDGSQGGATDADRLKLLDIDADSSTTANDRFNWISDGAFSGKSGELRYQSVNGDTIVQGDLNGDGTADLFIRLEGVHSLQAADFVL